MLEIRLLQLRLCKLAITTSLLNMVVYIVIGYQSAIWICAYGGASASLVYISVYRSTFSNNVHSHIFCINTFLFFFFFIITSGNLNSPIIPWLIMIPLISFQLFSLYYASAWTILNILFLLSMLLFPAPYQIIRNELNPVYYQVIAVISNSSLILFVITFSLIYKSVFQKMMTEISTLTKIETEQKTALHYWIKGQEAERKRIANDLHDGLAQQIVAMRFKFYHRMQANHDQYDQFNEEVNEVILELKRITNDLHPKNLELFGLKHSIELLLQDISENTHLQCHWKITLEESLSQEYSIQVYRIVQECLQNVIKHSGATSFYVSLQSTISELTLIVRDTGTGISNEHAENGIYHLKQRILYLNGTMRIHPQQKGSEIIITIPLHG